MLAGFSPYFHIYPIWNDDPKRPAYFCFWAQLRPVDFLVEGKVETLEELETNGRARQDFAR